MYLNRALEVRERNCSALFCHALCGVYHIKEGTLCLSGLVSVMEIKKYLKNPRFA